MIVLGAQTQHTRRLGGPVAGRKRCAERQRHLAEYGSWHAPAERARDPIEQLDHFHLSGNDRIKCTLIALVDGKFSRRQLNVGGGLGEAIEIGRGYLGEYGNGPYFVVRKHSLPQNARAQIVAIKDLSARNLAARN